MNDEIAVLNALYVKMLPIRHTLQKCLKCLCETKPYRMLKEWSYEIEPDLLQEEEVASHVCIKCICSISFICSRKLLPSIKWTISFICSRKVLPSIKWTISFICSRKVFLSIFLFIF